jgi:hypothetical protein
MTLRRPVGPRPAPRVEPSRTKRRTVHHALATDDHGDVTYTATTAVPYPHLERATAGLRAALRHQLLAAGVVGPPTGPR